jgi:hypothetical protein
MAPTKWEEMLALGVENALLFIRSAKSHPDEAARSEVIASLVIVEAALKLLLREVRTEIGCGQQQTTIPYPNR